MTEANAVLTRLAANRLRAPRDMAVTAYVTLAEGARLPRERGYQDGTWWIIPFGVDAV